MVTFEIESPPVGDWTRARAEGPDGGKAAKPVKSLLNRTWLPDFTLALASESPPTLNLTTAEAGDPSAPAVRSKEPLSEVGVEVESIPVKVGEDTFESTPPIDAARCTPPLRSSSVPDDRRPAFAGGLTESTVLHGRSAILIDRRFDANASLCRLFSAS